MSNFTKSAIKRKLRNGKCRVQFTALTDRKVRDMVCTLDESLIPSTKLPKGTGTREPSNIIRAFDTTRRAWRSFRVDNVRKFQPTVTREEEAYVRNLAKAA